MKKSQVLLLFIASLLVSSSSIASVDGQLPVLDSLISKGKYLIKGHKRDSIKSLVIDLRGWSNPDEVDRADAFANLLMGAYYKRSHLDSAIDYAQEALKHYLNTDDYYFATSCYAIIAGAQSNNGLIEDSYKSLLKSLSLYDEIEDEQLSISEKKNLANLYHNLGHNRSTYGDLKAAAEYTLQANDYAESLQDNYIKVIVNNQMSVISFKRKKFEDAVEYNKVSLSYVDEQYSNLKYPIYSGLVASYGQLGMLDSSIYYNNLVIEHRRGGNNKYGLGIALFNQGEIYRRQGDCTKAVEQYEESYSITKKYKLNNNQINSISGLCTCLVELNRPREGMKYCKEGIDLIEENLHFKTATQIYLVASQAAEEIGMYKEGLGYYKKYKQYTDSLVNQETEVAIEEIEAKMELAGKESSIKILEEEVKVNELRYHRKLLLSVGGLVALSLLGVALFFNSKRKFYREEKRRLELEQKLLRFQMSPHFIFNVISSIQNFLFDKKDHKSALDYLSKFSRLMRQVLEHSREDNISLDEELASIENYLQLQQLRYENKFTYDIDIDEEIDVNTLLIPPLILQPFVENAIEHGKLYMIQDGHLTIGISNPSHLNVLQFSIEDNGLGITKEKMEVALSSPKKSLATKITEERLDALSKQYKRKFQLLIEKPELVGTRITIDLPIIKGV